MNRKHIANLIGAAVLIMSQSGIETEVAKLIDLQRILPESNAIFVAQNTPLGDLALMLKDVLSNWVSAVVAGATGSIISNRHKIKRLFDRMAHGRIESYMTTEFHLDV